jgi:hypothetical protein
MSGPRCMQDELFTDWQCEKPAVFEIQPIPPAAQFEHPALACAEHAGAMVEFNDIEGAPVKHHAVPL